jgi:hypothetical protein
MGRAGDLQMMNMCCTYCWLVVARNNNDGWRIIEIIIGGAKSYSYIKYKPKTDKSEKDQSETVIKQKGITLDRACADAVTFETIKNMVMDNSTIECPKRFQFLMDKDKNISTKDIGKTIRPTFR